MSNHIGAIWYFVHHYNASLATQIILYAGLPQFTPHPNPPIKIGVLLPLLLVEKWAG